MKRRDIVLTFAQAALAAPLLGAAGLSLAQRPAHPIYRPRPGRPDGAPPRGYIRGSTGGVARGPLPGVFTVRGVNLDEKILRLADDEGTTGDVVVEPHVYDLTKLQPGDEVEVDFIVPGASDDPNRLVAATIWKLERATP